ncbi:Vitamin B12 import ATP-binding protein BtuD [Streptomyces badius]
MVQLIPGDPARVVAGADATPADVERARHDLGLDQPLFVRFGTYTSGLLRGDMGTSFQTQEPVAEISRYPHELSGGMRQRAMIAAALLPGPRLIVADEPTTALDVTVQAEVLDVLKDVNHRRGTSVLLISHDIGVVGTVCHRVVVMYAGRVVEELSAAGLRAGRARHPYTRALLAASPRLRDTGSRERAPLATIPGRPPTPADRPRGCAFTDRCPVAIEAVCATERPRLIDDVACHAVRQEVPVP